MGLPEPSLSFTIPSIHDDTTLDCRIYIPIAYNDNTTRRGAIIAHPYAPLGGCFDDPVVEAAAVVVLKAGWIVCTFNFRGASGSKGRTSWTGKAEVADYTSIAGFFIHYLHELSVPHKHNNAGTEKSQTENKDKDGRQDTETQTPLEVVFGGYSYGSIIASKLPSVEYITYRFSTGADGTAFTEIILRAQHLAEQTREELQSVIQNPQATRTSRESHFGRHLHIGGEETSSEHRRHSGEISRSAQLVRKLSSLKKKPDNDNSQPQPSASKEHVQPKVLAAYLLISPLLPPVSSLISLGTSSTAEKEELQTKLSTHPTLAVFGSDDLFTSAKKLRVWAQSISAKPSSSFQFVEINGAGHFWHEEGVEKKMRLAVREWMKGLDARPGG